MRLGVATRSANPPFGRLTTRTAGVRSTDAGARIAQAAGIVLVAWGCVVALSR
jgi:hypothetical protein